LIDDRQVAVTAATAGAAVVRKAFGKEVVEELKGTVDPVSEIDRAAENAILGVLRSHRPHDAVLAEESGGDKPTDSRCWIIDPLDGTVNFLHGIPHFAVSVALWDSGSPVACAIVDVIRDETFTAAAGAGALVNGSPVHVSTRSELLNCVVATGFPYDRITHGEAYALTAGKVLGHVRGVRRFGSAVLDFAWVACGRFDAFWEFNLAPWDVAAGLLLIAEAGGVSADLTISPASLTSSAFILSNADLGNSFIDLIRESAPGHVRSTN
jgi:myo-inositol-1(or 4)-monophosphatase